MYPYDIGIVVGSYRIAGQVAELWQRCHSLTSALMMVWSGASCLFLYVYERECMQGTVWTGQDEYVSRFSLHGVVGGKSQCVCWKEYMKGGLGKPRVCEDGATWIGRTGNARREGIRGQESQQRKKRSSGRERVPPRLVICCGKWQEASPGLQK